MKITFAVLALLGLSGAAAVAQDDDGPAPARIRHVEGEVTLQRATEAEEEPAVPNLIWLGGDRLWTAAGGRAELQLPDGSLIHLATASKLDLIGYDDRASALRLWAGSLSLWVPDARDRPDVAVETPDAVVTVREPGLYRIDAVAGETRLSVVRGTATLESGDERLALGEGERSWARYGEAPDRPELFDARGDAFDTWVDARLRYPRHALPAGVPEEVAPWAGELSEYGEWTVAPEVGTVWRPRVVAASWQPYQVGRWAWSPWGWTWVSAEPWGWAPYHYGRWGFSVSLGWYWCPDRVWGPAWVSWSIGGGYVGWSPLGRHGGPVFPHHRYGRHSRGWLYVHHSGLGARHLGRHRVTYARLGGVHFTHLGRGHQPGRRGLRGEARHAVPRGDRGAFGRLDRRVVGPASRGSGVRGRGVDDRGSRSRPGRATALGRDARRDGRLDAPARDRGDRARSADPRRSRPAARSAPARDRGRTGALSRSDRSRAGVAPRDSAGRPSTERRPAGRSRPDPRGTRSFDERRRDEPAARDRSSSQGRSRPAARAGTSARSPSPDRRQSRPAARDRSSARTGSRPAARSRSQAPSRTRSFDRQDSRPAARARPDRQRSSVAPSRPARQSRPAARPPERPRQTRPAARDRSGSGASSRPAARSGRPAAERSRPAARNSDRGSQRGGTQRSGRKREHDRRQQ